MRSSVLRNRIKAAVRLSAFGAAGVLVAGCSSGFERFDHYYRSATPQQQTSNTNPGIDPTTTASVGKLSPLANVEPAAVPQGVYHNPEPTYAGPASPQYQPAAPQPYQPAQTYQQTYQPAPTYQAPQQQPVRQQLNTYQPTAQAWQSDRQVSSSAIPPASPTRSKTIEGPAYAPPAPDPQPKTVYIPPSKPDPVTTASVQTPVAPQPQPVAKRADGWTKAGGTTITARPGETLYNLSKRYGVPVEAIRKANNLTTADALQAGQQVLIPNYVFSPTSPVSAPDQNRDTRAARASTGYVGEADPRTVAVPQSRPYYQAKSDRVIAEGPVYTPPAQESAVKQVQAPNTVKAEVPGVDPVVTSSVAAKAATAAQAPATTGISTFRWPVSGRVVSEFNNSSGSDKNEGIDISVPEGTAVKAAENGVVIYAGSEISSYGNLILIRHADDWVSAYAHNKAFAVKKGDKVNRGQIIARSGKTGDADRPKLHFELRKNSVPVDPKKYLAGA